jgi:hypothetical protein
MFARLPSFLKNMESRDKLWSGLNKSYLKDSQQKVTLMYSSTKTFNISFIQGSILGPILFLI